MSAYRDRGDREYRTNPDFLHVSHLCCCPLLGASRASEPRVVADGGQQEMSDRDMAAFVGTAVHKQMEPIMAWNAPTKKWETEVFVLDPHNRVTGRVDAVRWGGRYVDIMDHKTGMLFSTRKPKSPRGIRLGDEVYYEPSPSHAMQVNAYAEIMLGDYSHVRLAVSHVKCGRKWMTAKSGEPYFGVGWYVFAEVVPRIRLDVRALAARVRDAETALAGGELPPDLRAPVGAECRWCPLKACPKNETGK